VSLIPNAFMSLLIFLTDFLEGLGIYLFQHFFYNAIVNVSCWQKRTRPTERKFLHRLAWDEVPLENVVHAHPMIC